MASKNNTFVVFDSYGNFVKAFKEKEHAINYKYTFGNSKWKVWNKMRGVIG